MKSIQRILVVTSAPESPAQRRGAQLAQRAGTTVTTCAVPAEPGEALKHAVIRQVRAAQPDLVLLDVTLHPEGQSIGLTPRDWEIARTCPAPLLLVTPFSERLAPRVLAGINAFDDIPDFSPLNEVVLSLALRYARLVEATIDVASVFPYLPPAGNFHHLAPAVAGAERGYMAAFQDRMRRVDVPETRRHSLRGEPGPMLLHLAARDRMGVIVLGTHFCATPGRLLLGGASEYVLEHARCDVLLVKPASVLGELAKAA